MNHPREKFVRFQDWKSEKSTDGNYSASNDMYPGKIRAKISTVSEKFQRGLESGSSSFNKIRKSLKSYSFNSEVASRKKILDPQGPFLQKWNKIFVLSCLIAVSLDPLFFYVPVIEDGKKCLSLDNTMEITASVLRSFTDIFYVLHIIFQFRTGFIAPSSRVFGRGVLIDDTWAIAKRYLSSYFLIDILSVLPLPQVVILIIIPKMAGSRYLNTKNVLKFAVIFQYVPRFMRIYPLYKEVTASGILTETAWAGAAFNLFLYMLASHVIGAFWYLFSIERQTNCWRQACGTQETCRRAYLFYRETVGSLQYLSLTRPDVSFAVNKLAQFMNSPTDAHWTLVKRVLRYLLGTMNKGLLLQRNSPSSLHAYTDKLHAFSDADWAGNKDNYSSTSAYLVYLGHNLISWSSKKQKTVARSSTETRYRSVAATASELSWVRSLLQELGVTLPSPPVIYCDNVGATQLSANPVFHSRMKHVAVDYHFIRDQVQSGLLRVAHVSAADQLADLLAKPLSTSTFQTFRDKIGLFDRGLS